MKVWWAKERKASVTSAYDFYACQADLFPLKLKAEVSQPVMAWHTGRDCDQSLPTLAHTALMWKKQKSLPIPKAPISQPVDRGVVCHEIFLLGQQPHQYMYCTCILLRARMTWTTILVSASSWSQSNMGWSDPLDITDWPTHKMRKCIYSNLDIHVCVLHVIIVMDWYCACMYDNKNLNLWI